MTVYLNGAFVDGGAMISAADRGFLLGDGAFETIYVEGGRAAFLSAHLARLSAGLAVLGVPPPEALRDGAALIERLAALNGLAASAAARVTVSRGDGPRGLAIPAANDARPTVLVTLTPYAAPTRPARLMLSARRRFSGSSVNGFKSLSGYAENILALQDARREGADDAILLNEFGRVVSSSAASVFTLNDKGALATPSLDEGAMPGVVRGIILDAALALGVPASEGQVHPNSLRDREVFLTNSLIGLRPAFVGRARAQSAIFRSLQTWYRRRLAAEFSTPKPAGEARS